MNNLTNYHSHTSFCDGKAPMEAFIAEAVRQGFTSYGVSSHAPLPFRTRWTIDDREQTGLYLQEFARLKRLYGDRIELYVGLEIDYMDEDQQPANDYFQSLPLDYRIGSVHLLHSTQGEIVDIDTRPEVFREHVRLHLGGDLKRVVLAYFDKLMRMIGADSISSAMRIKSRTTFPVVSPTFSASSGTKTKFRNTLPLLPKRAR